MTVQAHQSYPIRIQNAQKISCYQAWKTFETGFSHYLTSDNSVWNIFDVIAIILFYIGYFMKLGKDYGNVGITNIQIK